MSSSIVNEFPGLEEDPLYGYFTKVSPKRAIGLFDGSRRAMAVLVRLGIVTETFIERDSGCMIYTPTQTLNTSNGPIPFDFDQLDWDLKINSFLDDVNDARREQMISHRCDDN